MNGPESAEFDAFLMRLGKRVKDIREAAGITQEGMDEGDYAVSTNSVQRIEYGEVDIRLYTLWRIARRLNVPLEHVFREI